MKLRNVPSSCLYNTKIKVYPDGRTKTCYCSHSIFHYADDEISEESFPVPDLFDEDLSEEDLNEQKLKRLEEDLLYGNFRRMQDKLFDLIYMNSWNFFLTITIDPHEFDSKDPKIVMKKLNTWLQNRVYRDDLHYLLIPEHHIKGGIHCHAVVNDALQLVDSGTVAVPKGYGFSKPIYHSTALEHKIPVTDWHPVYNCVDWKYGWSTAIPVYGEPARLAFYIRKYITKECQRIFGRYYWSSRNLIRQPEIVLANTDFSAIDLPRYDNQAAGFSLKYTTDITWTKGGAQNDSSAISGGIQEELYDAAAAGNDDSGLLGQS
ncbi:MAG: hypothetical protein IJW99_10610 [Clostridia bacterium]|nr:hypothetical protein [Clostridia bacterium]